MKNILHLASWYPNRNGPQEGDFIQRQLQALASNQPVYVLALFRDTSMAPLKFETVTNQHGQLHETIGYYNIMPTGIKPVDGFHSTLVYARLIRKMIKQHILKHGKPDLVHVHVAYRAGLAALALKKKYQIPFILTEHWSGYKNEDPAGVNTMSRGKKTVIKHIIRQAQLVLPVSAGLASDIIRFVPGCRTEVVHNIVDESLFTPPAFRPVGRFRVLHVSAMGPEKRPEWVLSIFEQLRLKGDAELVCVGEAPVHFAESVKKSPFANDIILTGSVSYPEVAALMKSAHALLITSKYETFSCVGAEALLSGLPVVSTPVGILPELIDQSNGKLGSDQQELVAALSYIQANYSNFEPLAIAGAQSGKFSYDGFVSRLDHVYNSL
jgi:glycosyltransferase involved in cell wall biosynthesis